MRGIEGSRMYLIQSLAYVLSDGFGFQFARGHESLWLSTEEKQHHIIRLYKDTLRGEGLW